MGTRATYKIGDAVFYAHWNGYRAGAAERFAKMIDAMVRPTDKDAGLGGVEDRRGGAVFAFIRGNLDVEPAWRNSHNGHADTDFRYDLQEDDRHGLNVRVSSRNPTAGLDQWSKSSPIPLAEFVNSNGSQYNCAVLCVAQLPTWGGTVATIATAPNARLIAVRERELAACFDDWNPNKATHEAYAQAWEAAALSVVDLEAARLAAGEESN